MYNFYKDSQRRDKKIYDIKQVEEYLNRVEGIKKDAKITYGYNNLTFLN